MYKEKILIITFGILVISCNKKNIESDNQISNIIPKVTIYDYQVWLSNLNIKELLDSNTVYIDTLTLNNRKTIIYCDSPRSDSTFRYSYSLENDSLFFFDEYCETIDSVIFEYNNNRIQLTKYFYDIKDIADEECYIYLNKKYGLFAVYNYPSGDLVLFENEEMLGFTKEKCYDFIVNQEKKMQKMKIAEMQKQNVVF